MRRYRTRFSTTFCAFSLSFVFLFSFPKILLRLHFLSRFLPQTVRGSYVRILKITQALPMISIAEGLGGVECCRGTAKDRDKTIKHTAYSWELIRSGCVPYVSPLLQDMLLLTTHACCHSNVLCIWLPDQNMYPRVL